MPMSAMANAYVHPCLQECGGKYIHPNLMDSHVKTHFQLLQTDLGAVPEWCFVVVKNNRFTHQVLQCVCVCVHCIATPQRMGYQALAGRGCAIATRLGFPNAHTYTGHWARVTSCVCMMYVLRSRPVACPHSTGGDDIRRRVYDAAVDAARLV